MVGIFQLFSQNKKTLALIIGLGLFFSLIPLHLVQADFWDLAAEKIIVPVFDFFISLVLGVPIAIIVLALFIVAVILGFLFFLVGGILGEFIKSTLSIMVVPGKAIDIVTAGWMFSRDFANMFLVLILAVIGLATILKLREYEAKKMLPMLLMVALLINFSGVVVGFIVDIGNLVTHFFIKEFVGDGFTLESLKENTLRTPYNSLKGVWGMFSKFEGIEEKLGIIIGSLVYGIAVFLFFVFGLFILLIIALIFFLRVIVLWILTILAPIAFLSRALPPTPTVKGLFPGILHWDEWWKTLIQWTIIGIPIGFFLVLSRGFFLAGVDLGGLHVPGFTITESDVFNPGSPLLELNRFIEIILAPTVGLILMGLGALISMKTAPAMAQSVISWGEKTGKTVGVSAFRRAATWGRERIAKSEKTQKIAQRMAMAPTPGTGVPGVRGVLTRTTAGPIWALGRAMGRAVGPGLIETERKEIDTREKKVAGKRVEAQLAAYRRARTEAERIGILTAMIKDRNIDAAMDVAKFGKGAITEDEIKRLYKVAQKYDKHGVMIAAFPHIARTPTLLPTSQLPPGISAAQFIFNRISPANYEYLSKQTLQDKEFLEAMLRKGTGEHVAAFSRRFGEKGASAIEERLKELATQKGTTPEEWLKQEGNIRLLQYLTRGAGVGLIHIPSSPPPGQPPGPGWTWTGKLWQPPPQAPRRPPPQPPPKKPP